MPIVLFRQIERKLIVDGQIVVTRSFARIAVIVIGGVTLFTMVAGQTFGAAKALARFTITKLGLTIALAFLALATIDRIAPVAGLAFVTVGTVRQVGARLLTRSGIGAHRMAVALACGTVGEVPTLDWTLILHIFGTAIAAWQASTQTGHGTLKRIMVKRKLLFQTFQCSFLIDWNKQRQGGPNLCQSLFQPNRKRTSIHSPSSHHPHAGSSRHC
jgi:hypothetical protein